MALLWKSLPPVSITVCPLFCLVSSSPYIILASILPLLLYPPVLVRELGYDCPPPLPQFASLDSEVILDYREDRLRRNLDDSYEVQRLLPDNVKFALSTGLLDVCATILPSYLQATHVYYDRNAEPPDGFLAHLSRASTPGLPASQTFEAHKDVLSHFMTYFSGLFRGHWHDCEHIDFGTSIPAATLKALIDFLYIGAWDDMRLYNLDVDLEELWIAADYLGFDRLMVCIEGLGGGVHVDSEDELWYTADECESCSDSDSGDSWGSD
ncbi:hypothetical protein BJX66DRAFT_334020 [Aspergillus keveii]|uniref:BTB domain-containing protein n=1 Tax=Aspergillus keveii TaxID=714993 RepID=A0ABR4GHZ8_9EURO